MERIAGSVNLPLSKEGKHEAWDVGTCLALKGGLDQIISSPMLRAVQTATIIAVLNGRLPVGRHPGLLPWCLGFIEGQPEDNSLIKRATRVMMTDKPELIPPGQHPDSSQPAESFDTYSRRLTSFVLAVMKDWLKNPRKLALVCHSRNLQVVRAWLKTANLEDHNTSDKMLTDSSGTDLPPVWKLIPVKQEGNLRGHIRRLSLHEPTDLEKAVYIVRHAPTAWDNDEQVGKHVNYPHAEYQNPALVRGLTKVRA